jgi:2-polyprenyl-3-methyl-5-hydroxy-6-metoxy-1,4-benzoquinol methylase
VGSIYRAEIDLRHVNDPHTLALGRVPARSNVLDIGVADGSVAAALSSMGCQVWGVEIDADAARDAEHFCQEVVVGNVEELDLAARFGDRRFDVVLMLDVLEHLTDPAKVLAGVTSVLADGGWAVISLPNVAHISVRLALLEGRFTYTDLGLLDRTHLRFFDRSGIDDLLRDAGWATFELLRVTRAFGNTEIEVPDADADLVRQLQSDPEALTYQFVMCAAPIGSKALEQPPYLPAAVAQAALLELAGTSPDFVKQLSLQLGDMRSACLDRRRALKDLLAALAEDTDRIRVGLRGGS